MVRWLRWHCPPDTGFEIRALAVWGRARYLSVTEAPHNTNFHTWMGKKQFCFFQTAETGNRTPDSGVKGSGANHYPRAPAPRDEGSGAVVFAACLKSWRSRVRTPLLPQTVRARISNPVSGGQYHLIHLTILRRYSWPRLAYMCTKVAWNSINLSFAIARLINMTRACILVQVTIYPRLRIVDIAISTNQKPTIYRNLYENTGHRFSNFTISVVLKINTWELANRLNFKLILNLSIMPRPRPLSMNNDHNENTRFVNYIS